MLSMITKRTNCTPSELEACYLEDNVELFNLQNLFFILLICSVFGTIFNSICIHVLTFSKNCKSRFLLFIRIDSIIYLVTNINYFAVCLIFVAFLEKTFKLSENNVSYFDKDLCIYYFTYFYCMINPILYTFSNCMDSVLVYEKIQIYKKSKNFFTEKSVNFVSVSLLLYSILLNIPVHISRDIRNIELKTTANETLILKTYSVRTFESYQMFFYVTVITCNFIRDIGSVLFLIILNIKLILVIKIFNKSVFNIISNQKKKKYHKNFTNDCKNILIKSTNACLLNLVCFYYKLDVMYGIHDTLLIYYISVFAGGMKSSLNLLIMLRYNKIFRQNFLRIFRLRR